MELGKQPGIWFRRCLGYLQGNECLLEFGVSALVVGCLADYFASLQQFFREKSHYKLKQVGLWLVLRIIKVAILLSATDDAMHMFFSLWPLLSMPSFWVVLSRPDCAEQGL